MFKKAQNNKLEEGSSEVDSLITGVGLEASPVKRGSSSLSVLNSHKPSVISEGFSLTGDIFSSGILHIEGKITGKVKADSINIGPSGQVDGELDCNTLHIKGMFSGSAVCSELVVSDRAAIKGSVTYRSMTISRGALIQGEFLCKR
jgi:hypothetical protein